MNPLQGLQVVITRPEVQALKWQHQLQAQGASTYLLPVMQIAPLKDVEQQQKLQSFTERPTDYQCIIFVSQNAVAFAKSSFKQLPKHLAVFAIGSATAKALVDWGVEVESAQEAMNSEELLQLESLQAVDGHSILICRGQGGRQTLATTLRERGASVDYIELYQRRPHPRASEYLANLPWQPDQTVVESGAAEQDKTASNTVISAHSGDSVLWLSELLKTAGNTKIKQAWPLLVPGERVSNIAQQQGFSQTLVARNASDVEMSLGLKNWWQKQLDKY